MRDRMVGEARLARSARSVIRLLFSAVTAYLLFAPLAAAGPDISGQWNGTYRCDNATSTVVLTIDPHEESGLIEGVFSFTAGRHSGSYKVAGRLTPDGTVTLVPRDWIDRPPNFRSLGVTASLLPSGRKMEGSVTSCMLGNSFAVTKDEAPRPLLGSLPEPVSAGDFAGVWQGEIACEINRHVGIEARPFILTLWQDGPSVGGTATVQIWQNRMKIGGPFWEHSLIIAGHADGSRLTLDRTARIDAGNRRLYLEGLEGELDAGGQLSGKVKFRGCQTFTLTRGGQKAEAPPLPEGVWAGAEDHPRYTFVALTPSADTASPSWSLEVTTQISKPEAERERLSLKIAPVAVHGDTILLAPLDPRASSLDISPRDREGVGSQAKTFLNSPAFLARPVGEDGLEFTRISWRVRTNSISAGESAPSVNLFRLGRATPDLQAALASGELPPRDFGPAISGLLAKAPSREGQCRVLEAWLSPHAGEHDLTRMPIDKALQTIVGAFAEEEFEPTFGLPFLLTTQQERSAVTGLIRHTCERTLGMKQLSLVERVLSSEQNFRHFAALQADRAETTKWQGNLQERLAVLTAEDNGLAQIAAVRSELKTRLRDLTKDEQAAASSLIDQREAELRADLFLAEAESLPDSGFDQGALNTIFAFMQRMTRAQIEPQLTAEAREIAKERALAILTPVMNEAEEAARQAPATLEGLSSLMTWQRRLAPARKEMWDHFGFSKQLALTSRQQELRSDPEITAAFRAHLLSIEPGTRARESVRAEAARFIDLNSLHMAPDWEEIIEEAGALAELRAVQVVLLAASLPQGAPQAEEIAFFALQRVRNLNAGVAGQEGRCLAGQFSNPIEALGCLPYIALGGGTGVQLLKVEVIGCVTEVELQQYLCTFTQHMNFDLPGGAGPGGHSIATLASQLSSGEAVDARFVRAATGGWTVVWGDLR